LNCPLITSGDGAFIEDAARFALGAATIERVGALHGMEPEQVLAALSDPGIAARAERAAAELERDGSAVRIRARSLLYEAIRRLAGTVHQGECSPSFLLRLAEVMGKLSTEPKEEKAQNTSPSFQISIDLGGGQSVSLSNNAQPVVLDAATGEPVVSDPAPGWRA
jgi:hypothetical protein